MNGFAVELVDIMLCNELNDQVMLNELKLSFKALIGRAGYAACRSPRVT